MKISPEKINSILGYLVFPVLIVFAFFYSLFPQQIASATEWLYPFSPNFSFATGLAIYSYIVLIGLIFFWAFSENFKAISSRWFFLIGVSVFLVFAILSLLYLKGDNRSDPILYYRAAYKAVGLSFAEIKDQLTSRVSADAYKLRGIGAWYIPFKLFGTSPIVYRITNLLYSLGLGLSIYFVMKMSFRDIRLARMSFLLYIVSPIGYFVAQFTQPELAGAFYVFAAMALFMYIQKREFRELRRRNYTGKFFRFRYEIISLLLMVLFGILCLMTYLSRNLNQIFLLATIVFFTAQSVFLFIRYGFKINVFLSIWRMMFVLFFSFFIFFALFRMFFTTGKTTDMSLQWSHTVNSRIIAFSSHNSWGQDVSVYFTEKEYRRQALNRIFFLPFFDSSPNFASQTVNKSYSLTRIYSNLPMYIAFENPWVCEKFFHPIRIIFLYLCGIGALIGTFYLFRTIKINDLFIYPLGYSFISLIFLLTAGEANPRTGYLLFPFFVMLATIGIGLLAGYGPPPVGRKLNFQVAMFWVISFASVAVLGGKIFEKYDYRMDLSGAKRIYSSEFVDNFNYGKELKYKNDNVLVLPQGVVSGSLEWKISDLTPKDRYMIIIQIASSELTDKNTYELEFNLNGESVYKFNKGIKPMHGPVRSRQISFGTGTTIHNMIAIEVNADENGELTCFFTVERENVDEPTWVRLYDAELISLEADETRLVIPNRD